MILCLYLCLFLSMVQGLLLRIKYFLKVLCLHAIVLICFACVTSNCTVWQAVPQDHALMNKVQHVCVLFVLSSQGISNWLCLALVIYILWVQPQTIIWMWWSSFVYVVGITILFCLSLFSSWNSHFLFSVFMFLKQIIKKCVVSDMNQRPAILLSSKV